MVRFVSSVAFALSLACTLACSSPVPGAGTTPTGGSGDTTNLQLDTLDAATSDLAAAATVDTTSDSGPGACQDGAVACHNDTTAKVCVGGAWQLKDKCKGNESCNSGTCAIAASCEAGSVLGCEGLTSERVCTADGKGKIVKQCKPPMQCAAGKCREVVCTPGITTCDGAITFKTCVEDGSAFGPTTSCKPGASCFGGKCVSLCEANLKIASNVGCEYWSADLDNFPDPFSLIGGKQPDLVPHSIVVSNPGAWDANLTFTIQGSCGDGAACVANSQCSKGHCGDTPTAATVLPIANPVVKAGQTAEFKMPVMNVDGSGIWQKGIHLKSDQPIVAFQFNPFNAEGAASNDGSLLLPQNALGKQYYAISRGSGIPAFNLPAQHGYFTIIAASKGETTVTVKVAAKVLPVAAKGIPSLQKGQTWSVKLKQFDVLSLEAAGEFSFSGPSDLTGSFIEADKPIAVFGGHEEAVEKYDGGGNENCCAEHVEEQLMPLESWGTEALCIKTKPRGDEADLWLVMAGAANVTIKTQPPVPGLDGKVLKNAGDFVWAQSPNSFQLTASGKVQVAQMIVGGQQTQDGTGDPTLMIVPPAAQFRPDYQVLTAKGYTKNYASVVRPKGEAITFDGTLIADGEFAPFGDGTWERAYVLFATGGHNFSAKVPFGLWVYGYGSTTAYGYPGGMTLK